MASTIDGCRRAVIGQSAYLREHGATKKYWRFR
jgi:hypothetical protein